MNVFKNETSWLTGMELKVTFSLGYFTIKIENMVAALHGFVVVL